MAAPCPLSPSLRVTAFPWSPFRALLASQPGPPRFTQASGCVSGGRNPSVKRDSCGKVGRPGLVPGPLGLPGPFTARRGGCVFTSAGRALPAPLSLLVGALRACSQGHLPLPSPWGGGRIQQPGFRKRWEDTSPHVGRGFQSCNSPEDLNQACGVAVSCPGPQGWAECQGRLQERAGWGPVEPLLAHPPPRAPRHPHNCGPAPSQARRWASCSFTLQPVFTLPGP